MFEAEGMKEGLPTRRSNAIFDADAVIYGLVAQVQDMKYDEEQGENKASVARNSKAKPKATKKIITSKKTVVIRINRQAKTDEKEFKANNEDNEAEDEESIKEASDSSVQKAVE